MNIELYNYYYESLNTLLHIELSSAKLQYSQDPHKHSRRSNINFLLKELFSNTNCSYVDFTMVLRNHYDLCKEFLNNHTQILSRSGFDTFAHHDIYLPHLIGSKFFDASHFNKMDFKKVSFYEYYRVKNPEIIDLFLDKDIDKSYLCKNANLSQNNINKILLEPDIGTRMGFLYKISQNNSFEYDGLKYNFKNKDKTELFQYLSNQLKDISDFKNITKYVDSYYEHGIFESNIPLNKERLLVLIDFKYTNNMGLLGNKTLTIDLLNLMIEKKTISVLISKDYKSLINNPSIPIEYKKKLNEQYYKELVFK